MAIPSWKAMPALICGNTVVIKPAEDTPLSTYNLTQVLAEAGLPPGVLNVVFGLGPDAGGADPRSSRCRSGELHRFDRSGPHREPGLRADVQEVPSRNGREEHHHRDGRRQPRPRHRRSGLGRLRHQRAALHGGQPRRGAEGRLPRVRREIRRAREGAESRRRPRRGDPDGPVHQRAAAADRDEVRRHRQRRRREDSPPEDIASKPAHTRAAGSTSRRSSPIAIRRCGSARRRFSARSSR